MYTDFRIKLPNHMKYTIKPTSQAKNKANQVKPFYFKFIFRISGKKGKFMFTLVNVRLI